MAFLLSTESFSSFHSLCSLFEESNLNKNHLEKILFDQTSFEEASFWQNCLKQINAWPKIVWQNVVVSTTRFVFDIIMSNFFPHWFEFAGVDFHPFCFRSKFRAKTLLTIAPGSLTCTTRKFFCGSRMTGSLRRGKALALPTFSNRVRLFLNHTAWWLG